MSASTNFERVEAYMENLLNAKDKLQFESDLTSNKELQSEYDAYLAALSALDVLALDALAEEQKQQASSTDTSGRQTEAKIIGLGRQAFLRAASVALLIFAGSLWFANSNFSNNHLAGNYYENPVLQTVRGENDNTLLTEATEAYQTGDFGLVIEKTTEALSGNPIDDYSKYLLANAYMKTGSFDMAIKTWGELKDKGSSAYQESASWYLALSFIENDQEQEAIRILTTIKNDANNSYAQKATDLLKKLDSIWRKLVF